MLKSAFLEVVNDKAYSKTSLREMYEMIKQWSLYRSLVDLVAKKHNVPAEDIIEYGKSHLEYPMYWNDPSGINSDKCRFLNGSILRELIEEAIEDSANITSDEVSQIEVGVHTPHGFEDSVKLADINDFCLRRLGITEEQLEKLGENDLVKSVRTKNEFKRGNNEYAERKMPDKKLI